MKNNLQNGWLVSRVLVAIQVEKYRLQTLRTHLGDKRVSNLSPALLCKYRDTRLKAVSPASLKRELTILSSVLNIAIKEWGIAEARQH